ncbi:MAG: hypothetical protein WCK42_07905, partial [Myxococcaceae bacterium]
MKNSNKSVLCFMVLNFLFCISAFAGPKTKEKDRNFPGLGRTVTDTQQPEPAAEASALNSESNQASAQAGSNMYRVGGTLRNRRGVAGFHNDLVPGHARRQERPLEARPFVIDVVGDVDNEDGVFGAYNTVERRTLADMREPEQNPPAEDQPANVPEPEQVLQIEDLPRQRPYLIGIRNLL